MAERVTHTDLLAMIAAIYVQVKLRFTPRQRYLDSNFNFSIPLQCNSHGGAPMPRQYFAVNKSFGKSFTKNSPCYSSSVRTGNPYTTTSIQAKSDTPTAGRPRRRHRSRCLSTRSPCRLFLISSHFWTSSRHGSLVSATISNILVAHTISTSLVNCWFSPPACTILTQLHLLHVTFRLICLQKNMHG